MRRAEFSQKVNKDKSPKNPPISLQNGQKPNYFVYGPLSINEPKPQNLKTTKTNHSLLPINPKKCCSSPQSKMVGEGRSYEDLKSLYTCKSSCEISATNTLVSQSSVE